MNLFKNTKFFRRRRKRTYSFSSSSTCDGPSKEPKNVLHNRHAAVNLTFTNLFRRNSSEDSYREDLYNFIRNSSNRSLGSDGCGSGSSSVSFETDPEVLRQLEMAETFAPKLKKLSEDRLLTMPLDQLDGDRLADKEVPVKILVIFCPEDEKVGNLFLDYLNQVASPFVEAIDHSEGLVGRIQLDHWQDIVDTASLIIVLMSHEFLDFARQCRTMSFVFQEIECMEINLVPVYLDDIKWEESDFLMDFENRWGINAYRNGLTNFHCWLKIFLTRHIMDGCPQRV